MHTQKLLSRSNKAGVEDSCNYYNCHFQEATKEQCPLRYDRNMNSCMEVDLEQRFAMNV